MERINDTHRRYPRTLQEAFGPYAHNHISEKDGPLDKEEVLIIIGCGLILAAMAVILVLAWVL